MDLQQQKKQTNFTRLATLLIITTRAVFHRLMTVFSLSPPVVVYSTDVMSTAPSSATFAIGDRFKTFEELESKLKSYEVATSTKFWIRDSRTIEAARKRTNRALSDSLKYYQVSFRCIHGGRKFRARGEGKCSTL